MRILVLGPGLMGEAMATLFLQAGHQLYVYRHRNPDPIKRLVAEGAIEVQELKQVAGEVDVVFSMLPNLPQIEQLLFEGHLAGMMKKGSLFLTMSTVSPVGIKRIAAMLEAKGIDIIDAPVSGGTAGAAAGTLTIMASGKHEIVEQYEALLQIVGKHIFYTGEIGNGQVVKLCNNLLASVIMTANAEVLALGVKSGVDANLLCDIIQVSTGGNRLLQDWIPKTMLQGNYRPGFTLQLMQKDVGLAMELARSMEVPAFLGELTEQLYLDIASQEDCAEQDYSVIAKLYEQASKVKISS